MSTIQRVRITAFELYDLGLTLYEIAELMGVSRERVRQFVVLAPHDMKVTNYGRNPRR